MQWWADTGLALHWVKSYQPSAKGCILQDYKNNVPRIRVLNLKDLSSAFVILLLGCALSLLLFLIEKILFHRTMRQKNPWVRWLCWTGLDLHLDFLKLSMCTWRSPVRKSLRCNNVTQLFLNIICTFNHCGFVGFPFLKEWK